MRPNWLNSLPPSWSSAPFGSLFTQSKRKNSHLQRDFVLSVMKDRGVIPYTEKGNVGNKVSEDLSGYKLVDKGDFVLNSMNLYMGSVGVSAYDGVTSTAYIVCKPNQDVYAGYYNYLIQFKGFQEHVGLLGKGIMEIREAVRWTALKSVPVPLPDLTTQRRIADFLDRETARIDLLIEKKLRLAALLGEKLQDDILRAVTLGIDPFVELVPEVELEWTSHRPKHWSMFRLKHFFRENTRYSSDGRETLFSLRMKEGLIPHNDVSDKEIPPSDLVNYKKVFRGQIVMNRMRAAIGLFGLANDSGIVSPDYSVFDVHEDAYAAYFLRLFKTEPMMSAFRLLSKGLGNGHSGFMRLNADNFGRIQVAVPPYEEQRLISKYVEERIQQITHLQAKNERSIDSLKEYRSSLITAAVTGQLDVETYTLQGAAERQLDAIQGEVSQ